MNINWKPNYIPGDLVYNHKGEVIRITSSYLKGTRLFYYKTDVIGESIGCILEEALKPIPITPEILEKNGWKEEVMCRGVNNEYLVYTKSDIEEYGYFPIYIEKGIGKEFDVYPFTDNHDCKQIAYIKYVHQLQHLLFGLGINHEMEV